MNFIECVCPKCQGLLQAPHNLETVICMYCGEKLKVFREGGTQTLIPEVLEIGDSEAKLQIIVSNVKDFLVFDQAMLDFTKERYPDAFREYVELMTLSYEQFRMIYIYSIDKQSIIERYATAITNYMIEDIESCKKGYKQEEKLNSYCYGITVYLIPAIMEFRQDIGTHLAEKIIENWAKQYPKRKLSITNYETLAGGFRKKGFCFITTAACAHLGKADDCYELNLLREYRDQWLINRTDGLESVMRYYKIAPSIVMFMNLSENPKQGYKLLWEDYILKCIEFIEKKEFEACYIKYKEMVLLLEDRMSKSE